MMIKIWNPCHLGGHASGTVYSSASKNASPLSRLAHQIAPTVNFLILPLFAFANASVRIEKFSLEIFTQPLALGITLGLFLGKQAGVMLAFLENDFALDQVKIGVLGGSFLSAILGIIVITAANSRSKTFLQTPKL
jgi:Na+/H+ antiporter NhaA